MAAIKKILIIRFSSIGDIVLTSPVVRCLKVQLGAEIHFLTKRAFAPIFEANPYIDKVYHLEKKVKEVIDELKAENYDHIVDLHKNLRSLQVKRQLKCSVTAFDKINLQKWLMVNLKINRLPDLHIVDRYLEAVAPLGIQNDGKGLDYFIPPGEEVDVKKYDLDKTPFITFAIGAAHATKRLPEDKIIEICSNIALPVVLLGGPGDEKTGESIVQKVKESHIFNLCGKLSLHQSASMVRQSQKVITHDTGMMHIAAAFQKEIISVWGNTIPAFGMYPYYPEGIRRNTTVEVKGLSCRPCSKIGFQQCPKGHFRCMREIDVERILSLVNP